MLLAVSANHVRLQMKFGFGPTVMRTIARIRKDGGEKSILDLLEFILYSIACMDKLPLEVLNNKFLIFIGYMEEVCCV